MIQYVFQNSIVQNKIVQMKKYLNKLLKHLILWKNNRISWCVLYNLKTKHVKVYPQIIFLDYNKSTKIVMSSSFKYLISSKFEFNV